MSALEIVVVMLVTAPLLVGALVAGGAVTAMGRRLADPVVLLVAVAVTVAAGWTAGAVGDGTRVVWPGGWTPVHGEPIGVALVIDRPAALLVCLVGLLTVAALTYSWHFLADTGTPYVVLVVVFLGACAGFALAGDVFDAFVWFELMGVTAYALTGMRIEEHRSVHGALTFGIVNTVGASLSLSGVALLYARTGELNLAAIGRSLRGSPPDHLVVVSCALLLTGVLVKMALVPFHFWTADAEAVAPTPVCVLLSGAMVTVGAFAVARWWWVVFDGSVPESAIRHALVGFGTVTAVVGAVMCASQRHLKRLLAYSTVAHSGVIACGIGLLSGPGIAAAGLYAVGHACTKGALFLVTGLLLNRFETLDEHELYRRGRGMWLAGTTFVVGGLALAGLPPFGTWAGKAAFSTALAGAHAGWLEVVLLLVSALTGGSVLRAGLRIFAGLGEEPDPGPDTHEQPEGDHPPRRDVLRVLVPPVVLMCVGLWLALGPGVAASAASAGATVVDQQQYSAAVLGGAHLALPAGHVEPLWSVTTVALGLLGAALATGFALASLWPSRLPGPLSVVRRPWHSTQRVLHAVHRAHVGDYVSWVLVGFAVLGATLLLS
ncbi:MAG: multicomponent Na+:H+ antiporter subunit [Nocardioidaceae bacterium]|jgi:multicomponent Na+:H+ antiporter subunit D|nr:multicomponent Na+:H+ antiporter subunit [Nocardioidaceae bacterium]